MGRQFCNHDAVLNKKCTTTRFCDEPEEPSVSSPRVPHRWPSITPMSFHDGADTAGAPSGNREMKKQRRRRGARGRKRRGATVVLAMTAEETAATSGCESACERACRPESTVSSVRARGNSATTGTAQVSSSTHPTSGNLPREMVSVALGRVSTQPARQSGVQFDTDGCIILSAFA